MQAVVLSIGSELLRGDILDTNAAYLTRSLSQLGFRVQWVAQVGDDLPLLTRAVTDAVAGADVVICTGGLGPTQDDLTREAIAAAMNEEMFVDESLVADIEARFVSMRRPMALSNTRQARRIEAATALPNPNGTAPGWYVRKSGKIVAALPGPPAEMQPMWLAKVAPRLEALFPGATVMEGFMTFGIGESSLEERIADIIAWRPDVIVATYAKSAGVEVHVTARAEDRTEARRLLADTEGRLRERLGDAIFGTRQDTLSAAVGRLLTERRLTLSVMESASGGELASTITGHAGSSNYFAGGIVAYSREMKQAHGVPADIIDAYGLYSRETASAMAAAVRREVGTDIGLGVTGIAGMEPLEDIPAGTCFVAVSMSGAEEAKEVHRPGNRETAKRYFAQSALDLLRRQLMRAGIEVP